MSCLFSQPFVAMSLPQYAALNSLASSGTNTQHNHLWSLYQPNLWVDGARRSSDLGWSMRLYLLAVFNGLAPMRIASIYITCGKLTLHDFSTLRIDGPHHDAGRTEMIGIFGTMPKILRTGSRLHTRSVRGRCMLSLVNRGGNSPRSKGIQTQSSYNL